MCFVFLRMFALPVSKIDQIFGTILVYPYNPMNFFLPIVIPIFRVVF